MSESTELLEAEQQDFSSTENKEEINEISDFHPGTVDNPFLYNATDQELQKFILTNMFVAGKNATIQQKKLEQFMQFARNDLGEYVVNEMGILKAIHHSFTKMNVGEYILKWLKAAKVGQYARLLVGINQLAEAVGTNRVKLKLAPDLHTQQHWQDLRRKLLTIKGIGMKTASMFIMYTVPDAKVACLDTHILKYLKEEAHVPDVPAATPFKVSDYIRLEDIFVKLAEDNNMSISEFDFSIWSKYRKNVKQT